MWKIRIIDSVSKSVAASSTSPVAVQVGTCTWLGFKARGFGVLDINIIPCTVSLAWDYPGV